VTSFIIEPTLSLYITTTGGIVHTHSKESQVFSTPLSASNNTSMPSSTAKLLKLDVGVTTGLYEPPKRILVVCSSHSRGIYLSEFAEPYNILRKKFGGKEGIEFIIASPKGGSVSFIFSYFNIYIYISISLDTY
jgi:hypothetical protein